MNFLFKRISNAMRLASIAIFVFSATSTATAGKYSDAAAKLARCESAGRLSESMFGTSKKELLEQLDKVSAQKKAGSISKKLAGDTSYLLFTGQYAKTKREAYMNGWAWCMDQE